MRLTAYRVCWEAQLKVREVNQTLHQHVGDCFLRAAHALIIVAEAEGLGIGG
jgi:hypothetical protein